MNSPINAIISPDVLSLSHHFSHHFFPIIFPLVSRFVGFTGEVQSPGFGAQGGRSLQGGRRDHPAERRRLDG